MQNLYRRDSGFYVLRIVVPKMLRSVFNKVEVIESTGTRELPLAKIIAGQQATQWRQRFHDASRLLANAPRLSMTPEEITKLALGNPILMTPGYLPIAHAASATGLDQGSLFRAAADCKLTLHVRLPSTPGHLLAVNDPILVPAEPELGKAGGVIVPLPSQMPASAQRQSVTGVLRMCPEDAIAVANRIVTDQEARISLVCLEHDQPAGMLFIPDDPVIISKNDIEVPTLQVDILRRELASHLTTEQVRQATLALRQQNVAAPKSGCPHGQKRLSEALEAYVTQKLPQSVSKAGEIKRIRNGCNLLIEFLGDKVVTHVSTSDLRKFRDDDLSRVPANENKIRLIHKTLSVRESASAVTGTDWPVMSAAERNKRMKWIEAWFGWMKAGDEWIDRDPTLPLRGESVLTKAERIKVTKRREDQDRDQFDKSDLHAIFGADWFRTGRGKLTANNTYKYFCTYYYWLPLLGLTVGAGRIRELCQLYLTDIGQTESGTWYVDFRKGADDQNLKNMASWRTVPIHPQLIDLGFDKWVTALREAGYKRLFPELRYDEEKGYGKDATKWFTRYKKRLGLPTDGQKAFHSLRHNFINALPSDTPDRIGRQISGHKRGEGVRDIRYLKDVPPDELFRYVQAMRLSLPEIAPFDITAGLQAVKDALKRKNRGHGDSEDAQQ